MAFGLFGDNPAAVDAVENIQFGAVVPMHHQGACVINADDRPLCTDRRSLYVLHLEHLHPCAGSELAAGRGGPLVKSLAWLLLFRRPTVTECRVARQIVEQDFPGGLVLITNEAEAQQKTPEGVLLVGRSLVGGGHSLLVFGHFAQCRDEGHVSLRIFRLRHLSEPRERNPVIGHLDG